MVVISAPSYWTASARQESDPLPVAQHRAGAARSLIAAFLRAGQIEIFAQRVEQRDPRLNLQMLIPAVDPERKFYGAGRGR